MGKGDTIVGKIYLREHSNLFRKRTPPTRSGNYAIEEDPVVEISGLAKTIVTILCRNKQRLLQQAWNRWSKNANVVHDYTSDLRIILNRSLAPDEYRTELEIEVLYKWAFQHAEKDPTGVASILCFCKKKYVVVSALQLCRLERIFPGDGVIFQGHYPRQEDGHFTIISGQFDALQFPDNSIRIVHVHEAVRKRRWEEVSEILNDALLLSEMRYPSGFGELATLTNTQRTASIRCSTHYSNENGSESVADKYDYGELLVVPKQCVLDCLEARRSGTEQNNNISEAIDFLRQSGLAQRISPNELIAAASAMKRRTLIRGEVIYCKGEPVESVFLVVSGDIVLDTLDDIHKEGFKPFHNINFDYCYHLSSGSILGDEGASGESSTFISTALVASDFAVVFEVRDFAKDFLFERLGLLRYSALMYSTRARYAAPLKSAENINLYSNFNSLRKCISVVHPFRETKMRIEEAQKVTHSPISSKNAKSKNDNHSHSGKNNHNHNHNHDSPEKGHASHERSDSPNSKATVKRNQSSHSKTNNAHGSGEREEVQESGGMLHYYDKAYHCNRRVLSSRVSLHHAEEALRESKKKLSGALKTVTQESILFNQIKSSHLDIQNSDDPKAVEHKESEKKMKSLISQYRERMKKIADDQSITIGNSHQAVQLFESFVEGTGAVDDVNGNEPNNQNPAASLDSESLDASESSLLNELDIQAELKKSRMIKYFAWIDNKKSRKGGDEVDVALDINSQIMGAMHIDDSIQQKALKMSESEKGDVEIPPLDLQSAMSRDSDRNSTTSKNSKRPTTTKKTAKPHSAKSKDSASVTSKDSLLSNDPLAMKTKGVITTNETNMRGNTTAYAINSNGVLVKLKFHRFDPPNDRRVIGVAHDKFSSSASQCNSLATSTIENMVSEQAAKISNSNEFFEILNAKSFDKRKLKTPSYSWSTRFMKTSGKVIPEADIHTSEKLPKRKKKEVVQVQHPDKTSDVKEETNEAAEKETFESRASSPYASSSSSPILSRSPSHNADLGLVEDADTVSAADNSHLAMTAGELEEHGNHVDDSSVGDVVAPAMEREMSYSSSNSENANIDVENNHGSRPNTRGNVIADLNKEESKHAETPSSRDGRKSKKAPRNSTGLMVEIGTLAAVNPISDALSEFQETMYTDYKKRSLLEGKKRANTLSRFELPKIVPSPSSEAAAELEYQKLHGKPPRDNFDFKTKSSVNSNGVDKMSLLLLNCLRENGPVPSTERGAGSKNLKSYLVSSIKTDDSIENLRLKKRYDEIIYESLVFAADSGAKAKHIQGGENPAVADHGKIDKWQHYTIEKSVKEKKGPKVAFPVVYLNNSHVSGVVPVDESLFSGNAGDSSKRSKRFGGGQLTYISQGESDEAGIQGPPSYLDLYKTMHAKSSHK